jgi:hypothetical protein
MTASVSQLLQNLPHTTDDRSDHPLFAAPGSSQEQPASYPRFAVAKRASISRLTRRVKNPFVVSGPKYSGHHVSQYCVTEPRDVTRVFKLISAPWTRARFGDVVGLALRFDALTIPRPGINEMECSEVDWDAACWTVPPSKMKTGWDHVVPLSRQALAILQRRKADRPPPVCVFLLEGRAAIKQHAQQALAAAWH